ncbi:MAG: sigma-54-dependent Fis family transcriptional regulator [Thermodesulfobacteriota bacterium]|nr:sigma-54-dependent Fis family transcriptional regulator [Thermodesulfobacteriota bacterium]
MGFNQINFLKMLSGEQTPDKLLLKFLFLLLELQSVERGSIWIKEDDDYVCVAAAGEQSEQIKGIRVPQNKPSIVGWVIENRQMTIAEAGKDSRHYKEAEDDLDVKSNLILGFPLILRDNMVYGAVEIIDTSAGGTRMNLDEQYLELLQNLVDIGSIALANSVEYMDKVRENKELKHTLNTITHEDLVAGPGEAFVQVLKLAQSYAGTDYPVLLTGESGTGKEVVAKEIHRRSARSEKPFLVQNCSAIPRTLLASEMFGYKKGAFTGAYKDKIGLFEAANGGTVFLDEIGDMSPDLQASLLRVLQEGEVKPLGGTATKKVDVRIISATNKDLQQSINEGAFREDLYFRINVLPLRLPPLRERPEDIPYLLTHFIKRETLRLGTPRKTVDSEAMEMLIRHPWYGNVRELENFVKQMLVSASGEEITARDLPPFFQAEAEAMATTGANGETPQHPPLEGYTWEELEKDYILRLLKKNKWVITRAAEEAGLNRSTFDSRMKRLGIRKHAG